MSDPYGNSPYYQQRDDSGSKWVGYLVGALVIGPVLAIGVPTAVLGTYGSLDVDADGDAFGWLLALAIVLPFLLPIPLLFRKGSRPWGVGILIGVAITAIVLGGLCAGFIYLLSQETA